MCTRPQNIQASQPVSVEPMQVGNGGAAADGGQHAFVPVTERCRPRSARGPRLYGLGNVGALLLGHRRHPRQRGFPGGRAMGRIADHEDFRMIRQRRGRRRP